jgi:phospholipid/cholesterol/gamma-HCH transport system ATP-binding protein
MNVSKKPIIQISNLKNYLGGNWVHTGLNIDIYPGEIIAIVGGSGCGKTTLLRSIIMLQQPTSGEVKVFDKDVVACTEKEAKFLQKQWGVMFQSSALFSSLTVLENVMFPLEEETNLKLNERQQIALLKIRMAGLEIEAAAKYPSELSGGMKKRAALARALALDPKLVFLDEPSSGLDPKSAGDLDELLLHLRDGLGLTFVMVTHDLDTLWHIPDRVCFLGDGKVLAMEPMEKLVKREHPLIKDYFSGIRGYNRKEGMNPQGAGNGLEG